MYFSPLCQPWQECFPVSPRFEQQPSERAELLPARKALTLGGGGITAPHCRRGRARVGIRRPGPGAGPSVCRLLPRPFLPRRSPHGPGGPGARRGHRSLLDTRGGEAAVPGRVSAGRRGWGRMLSPNPVELCRARRPVQSHLVLKMPLLFPFFSLAAKACRRTSTDVYFSSNLTYRVLRLLSVCLLRAGKPARAFNFYYFIFCWNILFETFLSAESMKHPEHRRGRSSSGFGAGLEPPPQSRWSAVGATNTTHPPRRASWGGGET